MAPEFWHADPRAPAPVTSVASFLECIAAFRRNLPGGRAEIVAPIDIHNGHARCTVRFLKADAPRMTGQYVADLASADRTVRQVGFAGRGPE